MKLTYPLLLNAEPQDKPYKIRDRDSMYLQVSTSRSKVWKFDYRLDGKDCSHTLGRFPVLSINDARQRRNDAAKLVASGIHPKPRSCSCSCSYSRSHADARRPLSTGGLGDCRVPYCEKVAEALYGRRASGSRAVRGASLRVPNSVSQMGNVRLKFCVAISSGSWCVTCKRRTVLTNGTRSSNGLSVTCDSVCSPSYIR